MKHRHYEIHNRKLQIVCRSIYWEENQHRAAHILKKKNLLHCNNFNQSPILLSKIVVNYEKWMHLILDTIKLAGIPERTTAISFSHFINENLGLQKGEKGQT